MVNDQQSPKGGPSTRRPLDGITVIEVAVWHAGPGAGAILADMGAEVIKVEPPRGDPERSTLGSRVLDSSEIDTDGWTLIFEVSNRNKKSVCIDLDSESGRDTIRRLVGDADLFITNLRASTKTKLGIDYETLKEVNPELIHVNVTGYGSLGARADEGGFDPLGQAAGGMMWAHGSDTPEPLPGPLLDQLTAIMAANAATVALLARERHGGGQDVHVSLMGTAIWAWQPWIVATAALGRLPDLRYNRRERPPMTSMFRCADGRWIIGANPGDSRWADFCTVLGCPDLIVGGFDTSDPERLGLLYDEFDRAFLARPAAEWIALFARLRVLFSMVQTFEDVLNDPQAIENGYVVDFRHPRLGKLPLPNFPIQFGAYDAGIHAPAPELGEHNDEVLARIGIADDTEFAPERGTAT